MLQANKQLVLEAIHRLDSDDPGAYAELHHPDYINHEAAAGRQPGREGARATAVFLNRVFSDMHHELLEVMAERDLVAVRAQASGRQVGTINGFPATGRAFSVQHIHMFRVLDGQIIEHWACRDDLGAARQLGFAAEPGRDAAQPQPSAWLRRPRLTRKDAHGHGARHATVGRDGGDPPASSPNLDRLAATAGPWMAWFGIPLVLTQPRRVDDRR